MKDFSVLPNKQIYLFELDDVLYPKRDYLLQVFYLFAQFIDYTEGRELAGSMVAYMKDEYEKSGETGLLEKVKNKFSLDADYNENYERLKVNAHLPLKLFLKEEVQSFWAVLKQQQKNIGILTAGNPLLQLNKLKHFEWNGWDKEIKIYFSDELTFRNIDPFTYIAEEYGVNTDEIIHFS